VDAIPVLRLRGAPALGIFSGSRRVPCGVSQCRGINGGQSLRPQQQLNHPRKEGGGILPITGEFWLPLFLSSPCSISPRFGANWVRKSVNHARVSAQIVQLFCYSVRRLLSVLTGC
jgi:hypothetical protein